MAMLFRRPLALARPAMQVSMRAGFATMPTEKPCPEFSSGPCKKRPGWSPEIYNAGIYARLLANCHSLDHKHLICRTQPVFSFIISSNDSPF